MSKYFGIRQDTIARAIEGTHSDLDYLCALIEHPDPGFYIRDAMVYAQAVTALMNQLEFFLEDISQNDLSEDGEHVKVSEEEVFMMQDLSENAELAIKELENVCGISLRKN